jgi:putative ABC transport system substrate-binding protein
MKRRAFIIATAALPLSVGAQLARKSATIGLIVPGWATAWAANIEAFRRGLGEHGYIESKNLRLEVRYAEGKFDRLPRLAKELATIPVDVLVTGGSYVTRLTRRSTQDIPIVMAYAGDPVGGGLVDSLARPGGRITGLTTLSPQLAAKRLELLKEILPKHKDVGVLWNPEVPERGIQFQETESAARKLGITIHSFEARTGEEIAAGLRLASRKRVDAIIVLQDGVLQSHLREIVRLATIQRLPNVHQESEGARVGGMLSYGASFSDMFYRAASYVDKVLKGAPPGELPIEQPNRFQLIINAKAAKALGVVIPASVLVRADEVIQ